MGTVPSSQSDPSYQPETAPIASPSAPPHESPYAPPRSHFEYKDQVHQQQLPSQNYKDAEIYDKFDLLQKDHETLWSEHKNLRENFRVYKEETDIHIASLTSRNDELHTSVKKHRRVTDSLRKILICFAISFFILLLILFPLLRTQVAQWWNSFIALPIRVLTPVLAPVRKFLEAKPHPYVWLVEHGLHPSLAFGLLTFLVHEVAFFTSLLPYLFVACSSCFDKYKVSKRPYSFGECFWRIIALHIFLYLPTACIASYWVLRGSAHSPITPWPESGEVVAQLLIFLLIDDAVSYFMHLLLHSDLLFEWVHKSHHSDIGQGAWTSEYGGLVEQTLLVIFPLLIGPYYFHAHYGTLWVWIVLRTFIRSGVHSGYLFPWSLELYFPLYAGAEYHSQHNENPQGNFANTFTFLDTLLGTRVDDIWEPRASK